MTDTIEATADGLRCKRCGKDYPFGSTTVCKGASAAGPLTFGLGRGWMPCDYESGTGVRPANIGDYIAEIERLRSELADLREASEATLEDEQAAHQDTLRLLEAERTAREAAERKAEERFREGIEAAAKWHDAKEAHLRDMALTTHEGNERSVQYLEIANTHAHAAHALRNFSLTPPPAGRAQSGTSGWKMMPVEPTQEMMAAGYAAKELWPSGRCDNQAEMARSKCEPIYRAMLAAAPASPAPVAEGS